MAQTMWTGGIFKAGVDKRWAWTWLWKGRELFPPSSPSPWATSSMWGEGGKGVVVPRSKLLCSHTHGTRKRDEEGGLKKAIAKDDGEDVLEGQFGRNNKVDGPMSMPASSSSGKDDDDGWVSTRRPYRWGDRVESTIIRLRQRPVGLSVEGAKVSCPKSVSGGRKMWLVTTTGRPR